MQVYFANRLSEISQNLEEVEEIAQVGPLMHVPGPHNPVDLPTRNSVTVSQILPGSVWQNGPAYLARPRAEWPFSRDFLNEVPASEMRDKKVVINGITALNREVKVLEGNDSLGKLVIQVMNRYNKWELTVNITARLLRAHFTKDRARIEDPVQPQQLQAAKMLKFCYSMEPTKKAFLKGDLSSLRPVFIKGVFFTTGRVGRGINAILGVDRLPILLPESRLAFLIMVESHEEDHRRDYKDTLARSRERAWVLRGGQLARRVCKLCPKCRMSNRKLASQVMGEIKEEHLIPCPPFTNVSLDFMGPYRVKGMVNSRAVMKVWGLVFACQNTRGVELLLSSGYATKDFMLD